MNKFNIIILLITISVLSLFNGDVLVVNANPDKPDCNLLGTSGTNNDAYFDYGCNANRCNKFNYV